MVTIAIRAAGTVLALLGLALTVVGVWFATQLGTSGTATFTTRVTAAGNEPVLIEPAILNRVDADMRVTATPSVGGRVWVALANPSDAKSVLGESRRVEVVGVGVREWSLLTSTRGSEKSPALGTADLWRLQDDAQGPVTLTVEQDQAPESVVIAATEGSIESVTLSVSDKKWFVQAVVGVLVGLFLVIAGLVALWPRRRGRPTPETPVEQDPDEPTVTPDSTTSMWTTEQEAAR